MGQNERRCVSSSLPGGGTGSKVFMFVMALLILVLLYKLFCNRTLQHFLCPVFCPRSTEHIEEAVSSNCRNVYHMSTSGAGIGKPV